MSGPFATNPIFGDPLSSRAVTGPVPGRPRSFRRTSLHRLTLLVQIPIRAKVSAE